MDAGETRDGRAPATGSDSQASVTDLDRRRLDDEARAREARLRLREEGVIAIEPEDRVEDLLEHEELVVTMRHRAALDRRQPAPPDPSGLDGDLYVTTRRLIHVGREPIAYDLDDIEEALVVDERLVLVTTEGVGIAVLVDDPRSLRVEIAAVRAARAEEIRRTAS